MSLLPEKTRTPDQRHMPPIPFGWQGIGFSSEIAPGQVVSRHVLGQDLVVFRGEDGVLGVLDAYCPHLGAHLGGGTVAGNCVQCPYHHWEFNTGGDCHNIPYASNKPAKATLRAWPVIERNGFILVWHHRPGVAPDWTIDPHPVVGHPDYRRVTTREHLFAGHPQDISENGADFAHFRYIHGWEQVTLLFEPDGPSYRVGYDTSVTDTGYGDTGAVQVDSRTIGPGYSYTHYTGQHDWLMISCWTPVDRGTVYLHQCYYARNDVPDEVALQLIDAVDAEWCKDIRIWESKVHQQQPVLCSGDGPVAKFRKWYQQFYA